MDNQIFKYYFFALIAICTNLIVQVISNFLFNNIYISISLGTFSGLFIKFLLDKFIIFKTSGSIINQFLLYSLTAIITTIIFWIIELCFYYYFLSVPMMYLGGFFGLVIGYLIKFKLDGKYVFR